MSELKLKKIALITDGIYPYVMGGMQKHSYYLCKYFAQKKIYIDLFHFNESDLDIRDLDVFTKEEQKYINSIVLNFPKSSWNFFSRYVKKSRLYSELIYSQIKNKLHEYDFIYTKGFSGWKLIEEKYYKKLNCCVVGVNFHGYEMFQEAPDLKSKLQQFLLLRRVVKEISRMSDIVFSYGGNITNIIKSLGVPKERIIEIPSGVEEDQVKADFQPFHIPIKFVYMGRYERRKGIEELNEAIKKIDSNSKFEFHFIGPIPKSKQVKDSRCIYHGELRIKSEILVLLRQCDVLVCPSWSEGLPNVVLEGMASGLAILATNRGSIGILVSEQNGILLNFPEPNLIFNALLSFIAMDKDKLIKKKYNSIKIIKENFLWNEIINKLITKISSAITQK